MEYMRFVDWVFVGFILLGVAVMLFGLYKLLKEIEK